MAGESVVVAPPPPACGGEEVTTRSRPSVATPDWLLRNGAACCCFWLASEVERAEAAPSLSSFSGGCSRWEVARRLGAA